MKIFAKKPVFKRPVSDDLLLALDIGTEFVKAVIGKKLSSKEKEDLKNTPFGENLEILAAKKLPQSPGAIIDGGITNISAVIESCEKAISLAEKAAGVSVKKTVVGIAGELVKGTTSTIRYRRVNSAKLITEPEIKLLLEKIEKRAFEKAKKELELESDNPNVEIRLINSALVSLTIDGYKISNPIGFKGSEVKIQYYTAFAPLIHLSAIEKVCSELSLDLLAVAVEPFAVCRACLGDDPESDFSGIVIDIGGGTTDVAVINSGGVEGTKMFNIGGRSFTRQISEALGIDFSEAETLKLSLTDNEIDDALRGRASAAVEKNLSVWLAGVELALGEFKTVDVLPKEIFLCGGGAGLVLLQESLALSDWYKNLPFSRRPVINLVDPEILPGIKFSATLSLPSSLSSEGSSSVFSPNISSESPLDFSYITALGLLRVGLDTSITAPEKSDLKEKLEKLLAN